MALWSLLSNQLFNELHPFSGEYFILKILFILDREGGITNSIKHKLFDISNVEIPSDVSHQIVESDSIIAKEAWIVTWNAGLNSFREHVAHWMVSQISCVSKKEVAYRAGLNANIFFPHYILEVWVQKELEPVADTFGAQKNSIK